MVDEAHATGTVGPGGRGTVAAAGLSGEVDLVIGTLGKALGSYGAYVCATAETVEYLVNTARSLIFSTALPPPTVAAADEALALLEAGPEMVQRLGVNAAVLRQALAAEGLSVGRSESQIVPVEVGGCGADDEAVQRRCSNTGYSPRGSGRRLCPTAPRACASRRWRATIPASFSGRRGSSARPHAASACASEPAALAA